MISPRKKLTGVMHLTDSLNAGGAERVAVNLANLMPRDRYRTHLCSTRKEGPLAQLVADHVGRLALGRRRRFDWKAIKRLMRYIREQRIELLHAHGSALLVACMASRVRPYPKLVWHDHFGRYAVEDRPAWVYRLLTRRAGGVIAVNQPLADWSRDALRVSPKRVWYLPNFACLPEGDDDADGKLATLPGEPGYRIICVANFRPEKDHLSLIDAMSTVAARCPQAHLLLVGAWNQAAYVEQIRKAIDTAQLERHVSVLGPRRDVPALLRACDVGVLSSASEGLPLSLLEYAAAGLSVVATDVGQCREVLDDGRCGILVPTRSPALLAEGMLTLLGSAHQRARLGASLQTRAAAHYSAEAAIERLHAIYGVVLNCQSDLLEAPRAISDGMRQIRG